MYALLKNHRINLASCIIDLIASIKLSKSKKFALPYGGTISKVLIHLFVFPCSSDHITPQLGPYDQTTIAKSKSLKRKRSIASDNTPFSSTVVPNLPSSISSEMFSCLEKMFLETREMVLNQVRGLLKEVANSKVHFLK